MPSLIIVISLSSSQLDASEGSALDVRLNLQDPLDKLGIGGTETYTPTRHVVRLRHGVELDAAVLGARYLKNAEMFLAEDKAVGIVVDHNDIVI